MTSSRHHSQILSQCLLQLLFILLLSSCSGFGGRSLFGGEESNSESQQAVKNSSKTVSRKEYNKLLKDYQALNKRYQILDSQYNAMKEGTTLTNEVDRADLETMTVEQPKLNSEAESSELKNRLQNMGTGAVAPMNPASRKGLGQKIIIDSPLEVERMENEIQLLRQARSLFSQNKLNQAFSVLKKLESSPYRQIQVRVRFLSGEILYKQGEFDLAMQVFEEILTKDAFSGVIIPTLGKLIACAEKLKLSAKKEQYHSMLYDFFGS